MPANARDIRDAGLIPGLGRSPGGGHGNPLQYSYLENPKDRGAWRAAVHRLTKSRTWLKRQHSHAHSRRYSRMYIYWLCKESLTVKSLMHNNDPFFKRYSWFSMLCWFLLYVHMHPLFSGLPSHLGHHRALSRVPCVYSRFSLVICFIHIGTSVKYITKEDLLYSKGNTTQCSVVT